MYTVFRVRGHNTDSVYYGYCEGADEQVKKQFLRSANRPEDTRSDKKWLIENNGDENIIVDHLDCFNDEYEAWANRNDYRSTDSSAITGPTLWPIHLSRKTASEAPEKIAAWDFNNKIRNSKNAREAYQNGAFLYEDLKKINSASVKSDLDKLTVQQFSVKYNLPILYKNVVVEK